MAGEHLGTDILLLAGDVVTLPSGDVATVAGVDCLVQDLVIRLSTPLGDLWSHPDFGVTILRFLQAEDTPLNRLDLEMEIEQAVSEDPRVTPGTVKAEVRSWTRDAISVAVTCTPAGESNPLNLVLGYGPETITVEVLRGLESSSRA